MNKKFKIGNDGEKLWIDYIVKTHTSIQTHPNKKFYDWDIKAEYKGREISYEVKYDVSGYRYAAKYNRDVNLYIEYENTTKNEPSGILASKADFYVYIFKDDCKRNIGYIFNRKELLKHLQDGNYRTRNNSLGGDNNAVGWLPPLNSLREQVRAIIDLDKLKPTFKATMIKQTL